MSHDLDLTVPLPIDGGGTSTALEMQWPVPGVGHQVRQHGRPRRPVPGLGGALGGGAHRPRSRPDAARRPARLGGQAPVAHRVRRPRRHCVGPSQAAAPRPPVPRRRSRTRASTTDGGRRQRCSGSSPTRRSSEAVTRASRETRAYFRGELRRPVRPALVAANWDSLVFDTGEEASQAGTYDGAAEGLKEMVGDLTRPRMRHCRRRWADQGVWMRTRKVRWLSRNASSHTADTGEAGGDRREPRRCGAGRGD